MPQTRSERLQRKAEAALFGAIEVYNKPDFRYREETFAILMLNAWELVLKARLLQEHFNDLKCLHVYERRELKSGRQSKRTFLKLNRSGNPATKSIREVILDLDSYPHSRLERSLKENIEALVEIRDNAIHFFNPGIDLVKQIQEVGTASVLNFVQCARLWFGSDLSHYGLYLLPVGFVSAPGASGVVTNPTERNLLDFLRDLVRKADSESSFQVSLNVDVKLSRTSVGQPAVQVTRNAGDGPVVAVTLSEQDVRDIYPWSYRELVNQMRRRYPTFKENKQFHDIRRPLLSDERFVTTRYLNPARTSSTKITFYNPNILQEFDRVYGRG